MRGKVRIHVPGSFYLIISKLWKKNGSKLGTVDGTCADQTDLRNARPLAVSHQSPF